MPAVPAAPLYLEKKILSSSVSERGPYIIGVAGPREGEREPPGGRCRAAGNVAEPKVERLVKKIGTCFKKHPQNPRPGGGGVKPPNNPCRTGASFPK